MRSAGEDMRKKASLILKAVIVICSFWGIGGSCAHSAEDFMGGAHTFLYFTIQSNLWIGVTCLTGLIWLLRDVRPVRWMYLVKFVFTVSITLTGFVFCFILAPTMGGKTWNLTNVLTRVIVPIASIADFLVYDVLGRYHKGEALLAVIPPVWYLLFSRVGYAAGWDFGGGRNYPYFFLNWGSPAGVFGFCRGLPFMGVGYWILLMLVLVTGVGLLYLFLAEKLRRSAWDVAYTPYRG